MSRPVEAAAAQVSASFLGDQVFRWQPTKPLTGAVALLLRSNEALLSSSPGAGANPDFLKTVEELSNHISVNCDQGKETGYMATSPAILSLPIPKFQECWLAYHLNQSDDLKKLHILSAALQADRRDWIDQLLANEPFREVITQYQAQLMLSWAAGFRADPIQSGEVLENLRLALGHKNHKFISGALHAAILMDNETAVSSCLSCPEVSLKGELFDTAFERCYPPICALLLENSKIQRHIRSNPASYAQAIVDQLEKNKGFGVATMEEGLGVVSLLLSQPSTQPSMLEALGHLTASMPAGPLQQEIEQLFLEESTPAATSSPPRRLRL